ncbi:MAG: D-alanyl-D-alanine carboxypeptidase [Ruminococcaceae bacterium]|nr:D-alanyl-D-alanine carboxypeptidase [Oscillospiraceae bacterium]
MKFFLKTIALLLFTASLLTIGVNGIDVSARSAVLIEADTGDVIYNKHADERMSMASTTKIMTALVAIENGDLSKEVSVAEEACGIEGSSIYLTPGEVLTLEDLLYAVMLESANDAAAAVAYEIAGGIEPFADLMNETAARLGLLGTHFTNPHGLDEADHYTTALDLARLAAYALENEQFKTIVSTYKKQIPLSGDEGTRVLVNHNKLLRLSEDVIGVKTGFTKHSGRCLVSAAERDGVRVIAVTLNAPDDWNDHLTLHELGFSEYESYTLAEPGEFTVEIPCTGANGGLIMLQNRDGLSLTMKRGKEITHEIIADHLLFAPVEIGEELGAVVFYCDGLEIGRVPLYSTVEVAQPEETPPFYQKILDLFR